MTIESLKREEQLCKSFGNSLTYVNLVLSYFG